MPAPYKHLDMTPEYNRIITALTNIRDDIRILRNRSEDGDGGIVTNEVMNGMQKALLAVSMSGAGGGNAEAVRQEIETPTALNGNVGAPAEIAGEDAIYTGAEWSRAGQFARFGIEEDIEEERFLIRVDGAFYYEADGGASEDDGENGPIKQVQPYTKGEYIGYKSMDPVIGYSTGEPSGEKNDAGFEDIADITLPNRRWGPKRLEWKTALDIPNPLADLVNPVSGAVQPKSKEQQNLEAVNSAVSPESANPLQALGIAAGIELIKSLPDFVSMGSDGTIPKPPEFDFPNPGGLASSMEDFIGEEWDGTIPKHVRFIDGFSNFGYGGDQVFGNEIGPYAPDNWMSGITKLWKIPNQGKIECAKFTLREDRIIGGGRFVFEDGNGQTDHWRTTIGANGPTQLIHWFSDTPGGPPRTNAYGKPIVKAGQVGTVVPFAQAYDYSFITGEGPSSLTTGSDTVRYYRGYEANQSVLFPVVSKTYFYNVALVSNSAYWEAAGEAPGPGDLVTYVPDPSFWTDPEDYEYFAGSVGLQGRICNGNLYTSKETTVEMFLRATNIRTFSDSTESIVYIGKDDTTEQFIGSNEESYPSYTEQITEWKYTDDTPVERGGGSPDIGFDSPAPIQRRYGQPLRKFPIPTNGKVAVAQFSLGYRSVDGTEGDIQYTYRWDKNNSKFSLTWTGPEDPLSNAVYDLDLKPIAWMSSEPGGEPQTLVDGVTGKVVELNCTSSSLSSDYGGQQLLSTTESMGSDRATFPIIRKNYFLNVAVVSTSTAATLVASGTAPSPEQCESWSVTDPALGYTGNDEQFLQFNLTERSTDRSNGDKRS